MLADNGLNRHLIEDDGTREETSILMALPYLPDAGIGILTGGALAVSIGFLAVPAAGLSGLILATMSIGAGIAGMGAGAVLIAQELSGHTDDLRKTKQAVADAISIGGSPLAAIGGIWANGAHHPENFSDAIALGSLVHGLADLNSSLSLSNHLAHQGSSSSEIVQLLGAITSLAQANYMEPIAFAQKTADGIGQKSNQKNETSHQKSGKEAEATKAYLVKPQALPVQIDNAVSQVSKAEQEMRERTEATLRKMEEERKAETERLLELRKRQEIEAEKRREEAEQAWAALAAAKAARDRKENDRRQREESARIAAEQAERERRDAEIRAATTRRQQRAASQGRYGSGGTGTPATPPVLVTSPKG